MKIIDLHHILYPMVTYYPSNDEVISYGLDFDITIHLEKSRNSQQWCLSFIERGALREDTLYFTNEYLACLGFLKIATKIISDIPDEMKVLDYREGVWYLLEKQQEFFLDVQCDLRHYSYSWNIKLDLKEILEYRAKGIKSLDDLAEKIYSSQPFYEESIFHFRKLDQKISAEEENAIIKFNQKRAEYVKKHYKSFTKSDPSIDISKNIISKNIPYWFMLIFSVIIILIIAKYLQ